MTVKVNWWAWPGWTWLLHTGEVMGMTFTASVYAAWQTDTSRTMGGIPWHHVLSQGAYAALGALMFAVLSRSVPNGTASFLPQVVSRGKVLYPSRHAS